MQSQKAVTAYFTSGQLRHFGFVEQIGDARFSNVIFMKRVVNINKKKMMDELCHTEVDSG